MITTGLAVVHSTKEYIILQTGARRYEVSPK